MRTLAEKYHEYCWKNDFTRYGRGCFRTHNDTVRQIAEFQGRELLEFDVKDGWEPLCKFLEMTPPGKSFPRKDELASYKQIQSA